MTSCKQSLNFSIHNTSHSIEEEDLIETFFINGYNHLLYTLETNGELDFASYEIKPEKDGGIFIVKELVYHFAMWLTSDLYLKVIRSFDELKQQGEALFDHAIEAVLDRTDLIEDQLIK